MTDFLNKLIVLLRCSATRKGLRCTRRALHFGRHAYKVKTP